MTALAITTYLLELAIQHIEMEPLKWAKISSIPIIQVPNDISSGDTGYDLFFYDGNTVVQVTNNPFEESYPAINNIGTIAWYGTDVSDHEIFQSKAWYDLDEYNQGIASEESKWDADGDGKIGLAEAIQALKMAVAQ